MEGQESEGLEIRALVASLNETLKLEGHEFLTGNNNPEQWIPKMSSKISASRKILLPKTSVSTSPGTKNRRFV